MSPGPQGTSLGIDFGTSHTIAVVRRADGGVRPLLFDGAPLMPSAVCADAEGGLLVGRDAVHAGRRHPERFEPNPKRLIDRPSTLLGSREYPVPDLIAAVLGAVADECRRVVGVPAQVTLTVPAEWGPARRQVVEDAAARSGLGRVRLVPEPVAAATYYAEALKHRTAVGSSIVVYDLGAGTFDASVVRRTESGFETVALDGRGDLGGLDIDAALIDHLGKVYGTREGWQRLMHPETVEERRHLRDFQEEVRGAKERLSRHQQSDIAIPLLDVEAHLTRSELEQIARPHLEQTIRVTLAVIRAAGLNLADSAGVFLVGGASRMPLVATMLHRELGIAPTVLDQPEVVVAEGSVLWTSSEAATLPFQRPYTPVPPPVRAAPVPLTPQNAPGAAFPPRTQPQPLGPPPQQDTPPEPRTAPVAPFSPPPQTLPPRTAATPPAPAPEPPETDAERLRRKRTGRRVLVWFVVVDLLIVAGLAWYFNRDEGADGTDQESFDAADSGAGEGMPAIGAQWSDAEMGDQVDELLGAHDSPVSSMAALETDDGPMLLTTDGSEIRQWSMDTGAFIAEYAIDGTVGGLWTVDDSEGVPSVVALTDDYEPWMWTPGDGAFAFQGTPDLDLEDPAERVRVAFTEGEPVVAFVTATQAQMYLIESQSLTDVVEIPAGLGYPNYYIDGDTGYSEIATVSGDELPTVVDGLSGSVLGTVDPSDEWSDDADVSGMGVVYDDGTPYAMVYDDRLVLHFWSLYDYTPALNTVAYASAGDRFHNEILAAETGPALMYRNKDTTATSLLDMQSSATFPLEPGGGAEVTSLENITVDGGRDFAVTGDSNGNIQFWSLGL
ncbi:Hsp70 family protein [Glycomyces endophyticus]